MFKNLLDAGPDFAMCWRERGKRASGVGGPRRCHERHHAEGGGSVQQQATRVLALVGWLAWSSIPLHISFPIESPTISNSIIIVSLSRITISMPRNVLFLPRRKLASLHWKRFTSRYLYYS